MSVINTSLRRAATPLRTAISSAASSSRSYASPATSTPTSTPTPTSSTSAPKTPSLPEIHLGPTHPTRYRQHYDNTLASDLLYKSDVPVAPQTPYELNRPTPPLRGNRPARPAAKAITAENVPHLESIILHTMVKEAIGNKQALLTAIMALRAISGQSPNGGGRSSAGVEVLSSKTGAAAFKLRSGMPVAVKVELRGEAMYDFIQSLVDFVMPRIREYPGIALPPPSASRTSPSAVGGVVAFGLPSTAMSLFPQVEANLDAYPRLHGFHMYFKTSAKGERAQEQARALLSGFRIPFYRR
jgi:large subunit ribosomal protein L5